MGKNITETGGRGEPPEAIDISSTETHFFFPKEIIFCVKREKSMWWWLQTHLCLPTLKSKGIVGVRVCFIPPTPLSDARDLKLQYRDDMRF